MAGDTREDALSATERGREAQGLLSPERAAASSSKGCRQPRPAVRQVGSGSPGHVLPRRARSPTQQVTAIAVGALVSTLGCASIIRGPEHPRIPCCPSTSAIVPRTSLAGRGPHCPSPGSTRPPRGSVLPTRPRTQDGWLLLRPAQLPEQGGLTRANTTLPAPRRGSAAPRRRPGSHQPHITFSARRQTG